MQIHFTGKNIQVTADLKTTATKKLEVLPKHFKHLDHLHLVFIVEHGSHIVEGTLKQNGSPDIHAKAESSDMYASIDMLVEKLSVQLKKHKDKLIDQHQRQL